MAEEIDDMVIAVAVDILHATGNSMEAMAVINLLKLAKTAHEANGQALFAFDERDKADTLLRDAISRRKALENVAGVMAYALKHGRPWSEAIERQYHKAMGFDHALAPRTKP